MNKITITNKTPFGPVEPVQPATPGSHPKISMMVLDNRRHKIAADAGRIFGYVFVDRESVSVIPVQTVSGTEPHKTGPVPQDAGDIICRETRFGPEMDETWVFRLRMNHIRTKKQCE